MADTFTTSNPKALVVDWEVLINGGPVPTRWELESIKTRKEVGKIPSATVKFTEALGRGESDMSAGSGGTFPGKPGDSLEIKVGTVSTKKTLFKGEISDIGIGSASGGGSSFDVSGKDKADQMTVDRKNEHFLEMTDSQVMTKLISRNGCAAAVDGTDEVHPDLPQYDSTDWDFLLSRADFCGFVVVPDDGKVEVTVPGTDSIATYSYGIDIADIKLDIKTKDQVKEFKATAWDPDTQETIVAISSEPSVNNMGMFSGPMLAEANGNKTHQMYHMGKITQSQLQSWVDGNILRTRLGRIQGSMTVDGNFDLKPNKLVTLQGIGEEVDGDAYINAVEHSVSQNNWDTTLQLGMPTQGFTQSNHGDSIATPTAGGQLPGVGNGNLQLGKVVQIHTDPEQGFRVKVDMPVIGDRNEHVWARINQFQASNQTGYYSMPEEGDEVLLSFINGDPRYPVIMGSVYSKKIPMPVDPDGGGDWDGKQSDNNIKGFFSREGLRMRFQETDKIIMIDTPAGNVITMTEKDQKIIIEDENKNKIEMHPGGIDIYTPKDLKVNADMNIKVEAKQNIEFKAGMNFKVQGMTVATKADTSNKMEGMTSEVKGSATTTVKGGMVMIN